MTKLDFHVIIPARYESTRLPGKLLLELNGSTIIEHVYRQALKAQPKSIIIATDNSIIAAHAKAFGAQVSMTAPSHRSGTERLAEVITKEEFAADDIIVNLQGDEPLMPPVLIRQVAASLSEHQMATLCWPIDTLEQLQNPNVVKVVRDCHNNALYFSRSPIPGYPEALSAVGAFRHVGLYAYRAAFLLKYVNWPSCELENAESLEQLRVLWAGYKIRVEQACSPPLQDINTWEDLVLARKVVTNFPP